jgi:anti-sigma B factor antagonist
MFESSPPADLAPTVTARRFAIHGVCLQGRGELDMVAAPLFGEAISAAIAAGHRHLVVDLAGATHLDCACLGAILAAMRPLSTEEDAALVLAGARGSVERLLALLEFDRTCSIVSSVRTATTLALDPNGGRVEGWRSDGRAARASATDLNPPIQSGGNDELSP